MNRPFRVLVFLLLSVLTVGYAQAQEKPATKPASVELTDVEKLKLDKEALQAQVEALTMQLAEAKYAIAQQHQQQLQSGHVALTQSFLKDHGLDEKEYSYNEQTLSIIKKPDAAPQAKPSTAPAGSSRQEKKKDR